jgi:hypothetical protein
VRDGYIYQRHPSVSEADEKKLHRFVRKQEKLFARELAPVPRPKENRPIIAVFSRRGDMGPIDHEAAADKSGTHFDSLQRRIYTLRLSDEQEAPLANDLAYLFCMQAFGGEPDWFYQGESEVAYQHARTGGKPTTVTKYRYDRLPWEGPRFDAVRTSRESDWEGFIKGSIGYTIFFHAGPSKYRKAYRNFLKDLRETGDWVEAERVHLLSLDQDRMAAAMKVFLEKRVRHTNTD